MAGRHAKRKTRTRNAKIRRCAVVGLSTTAGAFLAAAANPFSTAPPAEADFEDLIIDLIDPGSIAAAVDPASIAAAADAASSVAVADPAAFAAVADPGAAAAAAVPAGTFPLSELLAELGLMGNGTTDSTALSDSFQQGFYQPVHTFIADWMNNLGGEQIETQFFQQYGLDVNPSSFCGLICDGADGTQADPTGGGGGLLAGDGGAGWLGAAGGNGGDGAGIMGNGGAGGAGGAGGPGVAPGNGGNGGNGGE